MKKSLKVKSSKGHKTSVKKKYSKNVISDTHVNFGFDLFHLEPMKQVEVCHYLVKKVDHVAKGMGNGATCNVNFACGLLQVSIRSEDPHQALKDFMTMVQSGEIDIPGVNAEAPIAKYMAIGEGSPIRALFGMAADDKSQDFLSDDRRKAIKELESALTRTQTCDAKEAKAKGSASNTHTYFAPGFGLDHLEAREQVEVIHRLAGQIDRFARGLNEGYVDTFNFVLGLLQISVHCKDPKQAAMVFLAKMEDGEIDVPENNDGDLVFEHLVIGKGDPLKKMFQMPAKSDFGIPEAMKEDGIEMSETTDPLIQAAKWALGRGLQ